MTKDYLYLTGFKDIVSKVEAGVPIQNLLLGKTSLDYLDLLNELVERKVLHAPRHIADFLKTPKASSPVLDFVIRGICA
ncbi:tyrosine/phenylalanine carboxypeptidase domain-containing protein [Pseudobacteriovorax antillogorgiicola]|uniref:Uncharacterized protein n=1 Tax=Pseudobacteriovorax antillogorgiicola TaxID=1513793 RepID=A0A1Y6BY59_9BACT|nr:tyrosine/phenylalanine carboxypeptidase domain-containing protein [Pseudobacteriovorax antillogorgiicola]TCS53007.1 uncharacterized protein DUF1704 [Pseudobacteriovorax antillogorgiicola]SMF27023.1 protein of unknown function [Pseudobacteriovorax antillogorgiicola]